MTASAAARGQGKWSDKAEGEDGLRTVTVVCLRGRLLAERAVSRNTKQEAQQIEYKLAELEKKLKEETRSRNKAEKRLKSLLKKLEPLNLSHAFDECEYSASLEKSEISSESSSSVISSTTKQTSEVTANFSDSTTFDTAESVENANPADFQQQISQNPGETSISGVEAGESAGYGGNPLKMDDHGWTYSVKEEEDCVDNSLALVVVDMEGKKRSIDPTILDATVKEVLDALRHAKEKLQRSMERRRMIKVG